MVFFFKSVVIVDQSMNAIRIGSPARHALIAASRNGETVMNNECNRVVDSQVEHAIDCRVRTVFSLAGSDTSTSGQRYQSGC